MHTLTLLVVAVCAPISLVLLSLAQGAGSRIPLETPEQQAEEALRKSLRQALVRLALAGVPNLQIMRLAAVELRFLAKAVR